MIISDIYDDDDDDDDRAGTEEAGAGTLQMWRIVAREAGVRGEVSHMLHLLHERNENAEIS